jgi:transposase-like protein/predicted RNA-binding Zn-ribbon protein involved in translation (DUF1610 family)
MTKLKNPRELRGLAILSIGNTITQIDENAYIVKSQTGVGEYKVNRERPQKNVIKWKCSCPDYAKHQKNCKHIFAVLFSKKLRNQVEKEMKEETEQITFKPDICPKCDSENIIKSGKRITNNGNVQRYKCRNCNFRFVIDKGFSRMKHDPKAITLTMDLYFKGVSLRKITDHLKQFYGLKVAQTTPMRWIRKYMALLSEYAEQYKVDVEYAEQYKVDVGEIWHSDEMTVNIREEGKKNNREWIWNLMDGKTRYLLACKITKHRNIKDAQKPLKDAKKRANKRPDAIVTDGLPAYNRAIKNEYYDSKAVIRNPHIRLKSFEVRPNNNIVERLNGTVRERLKVMRGLDSEMTAEQMMDSFRVYYNYIRPHQSLNGMTPAEICDIPINLSGNKWLKMIEMANYQKHCHH